MRALLKNAGGSIFGLEFFDLRYQVVKLSAVYERDFDIPRKVFGFVREVTRRDDKPTRSAFGRHDTKKLANHANPDTECFPLFALHQKLLIVLSQYQVDTTISTAAAILGNLIALHAKGFTDQKLEFLPAHSAQ